MMWLACVAWAALPDRSRPPPVAPPVLLDHPEPAVYPIAPGVVAWHVPVPVSRKDTVQIVWRRGAADVLGESPLELARAVGALADRAGGAWSARQIDEWLDLNDASMWASVGQHEMEVGFTAPPEALGEAFARASAIVHDPRFPAAELDRWVFDQDLALTSSGPASPSALSSVALASAWFPSDHPYGKRPSLVALHLVRRAELVEAWGRWTTAAPIVVLAVGQPWSAFEPHVAALVAGRGADLPPGRSLPFAPGAARTIGVDLAGAQANVGCRVPAPAGADADAAVMRVANMVLGGTFNARLNRNLREDKGLTYGIDSEYRRDATWGLVSVEASVPASGVVVALSEIRRELVRLSTDPPTAFELESAKRAIVADWNRAFENAPRAADLYRRLLYDGHTVAEARAELERVLAVGPEDVTRVASAWLALAPSCVVVGPRAEIEPELGSIGIVAEWVAPAAAILGRF